MSCERANVRRNVEKARLINRRTYFNQGEMLWRRYVERNAGKRNYCTNVAINGKKDVKRILKNCVNVLTCRQISYERTNGPFKETYSETFWRRLSSFERSNDGKKIKLPPETRISRQKRWEDKTSIIQTLWYPFTE